MKRFITLLTAFLLSVMILPFAANAIDGSLAHFTTSREILTFVDVSSGDWFAPYVQGVSKSGLMIGVGGDRFAPEADITLAEVYTVTARIHAIYHTGSAEAADGYDNRHDKPWFYGYVKYCMDNGIMPGEPGDVSQPAVRIECASLLSRALPEKELRAINTVEDNAIPDLPLSPDRPNAADVYKLYRAGVLTGVDEAGTFMPESKVRRCEVAAVVSRLIDPELRQKVKGLNVVTGKPVGEEAENCAYLSITGSFMNDEGVLSEIYCTYDPDSGTLDEYMRVPATSAYPCSVCDRKNRIVYYSAAVPEEIEGRSFMSENVYACHIDTGNIERITDYGTFMNRMILVGDRLYYCGGRRSSTAVELGCIDLKTGEAFVPDFYKDVKRINVRDISYNYDRDELTLSWYSLAEQSQLDQVFYQEQETLGNAAVHLLAPSTLDRIDMKTSEVKTLETITDGRPNLLTVSQSGDKILMYAEETDNPMLLYEAGEIKPFRYHGTALAALSPDGESVFYVQQLDKTLNGVPCCMLMRYDIMSEETAELIELPFYVNNMVLIVQFCTDYTADPSSGEDAGADALTDENNVAEGVIRQLQKEIVFGEQDIVTFSGSSLESIDIKTQETAEMLFMCIRNCDEMIDLTDVSLEPMELPVEINGQGMGTLNEFYSTYRETGRFICIHFTPEDSERFREYIMALR